MTDKITIWQKINKPIVWKILPWVILGICILAWILGYVPTPEKDRQILQLQSVNKSLEEGKIQDSIFRNIIISKIDVLQNSYNKKDNDKIRIYERIQNDIHHYDTASINEIQRFFADRYGKE